MSLSTVIYEASSFSPAIPALLQFRESHQESHFDGKKTIIRNNHDPLARASAFIRYLERNLNTAKESKSPLQTLLERSLYLPATEESRLFFLEITKAFFKQKGYFSRLFSNESWEEWFEHRTALGKVAFQFRNCIECSAEVCSITKAMNLQLLQKADDEANVLLKGLDSREVTRTSKGSCLYGLTSGIAASFLFKNPLPFLLGWSECFPRAHAQQKIGNEFQVNTYTNSIQRGPSVASFSNGNFVVTWQSYVQDGSSWGVYGQLFDGNGTKIGSEFQANSYITDDQEVPSVASFSNGNFVVTWESNGQDGSGYGIYGQLFDGNGTKIGSEFQANSYITDVQESPSIASFSNGNFVVTWHSQGQDGSNYGIYGQLFDGSDTKIGSEFRANSFITNDQLFPSVASLANGNFVVIWQSNGQDSTGYGIYGQLFDGNGTKIGSEFQANSYTTNRQLRPSIASFSNGNFVVTWESEGQDGSLWGVYGQLFDENGTKIGSEFRANSYTTSDQRFPSVASFSNDNFVVTWHSNRQDGDSWGVYGQLFDGNGSKIGSEFRANSYTTSFQWYPSVASLADGNFVVTWQSEAQDGSNTGVYGQIFNDVLIPSSTTTTTSSTSSTSTAILASSTRPTSSTHPTSSIPSSTLTSTHTFSSLKASSPPKRTGLIAWISLGVGGLICFCVTPLGFLLLRKRKSQTGIRHSEETGAPSTAFELEPVVQRHKIIGKTYYQLSTIDRKEAGAIFQQTGHLIYFPEGQKKLLYVIGSGQFGKIKVAQRIADGQYVASKKVKGEENIRASEAEAQMQQAASGDNVLPIYNTIRLEEALYHFMPLAGLGDGSTMQRRLALLNQSPLALAILQFIAQNILTGLQTIHAKGIYHLDIKPDNIVFTKDGIAYITDFGCAQRTESRGLTGEALGDNRYFSPERLRACREGTFDAEKADIWAAGVTLLQIFCNKEPLEFLNMPHRLAARVERCDQAHFDQQLQRFSEVEEGSILWVIKGLLVTNPKTRLTATQALKARCFQGFDITQQEQAFEELRRETFAQHEGIEQSEVNLGDYGWVMQRIPEEERGQSYRSEMHQQFYGYSLTPDLHQFTTDQVTASSSAASGYQLTP